jgi:hypothetical protein
LPLALCLDGEQSPCCGDAFELVLAAVGQGLIGSYDEIPDGAAHEDFARTGEAANARTDVHREAADVVILE